MWLSRLDLLAYGRFTDVHLPLGPGFHLVYGPNEAGKSTTLRAIRQLLFGIDERTSDNFVHSNSSLRIGGIVCDETGRELHVIRRKARKESLHSAADESAISADLWQQILMGIDEATFCQRYGIDYDQLKKGGHDIATGSGDLGEILFATGSGVKDLAAIEKKMSDEAAEIFKPLGKKQRLNQAITEWQLQREDVATKLLSVTAWEETDLQRQQALAQLDDLSSRWTQLEQEIARLKRWQQAKSVVEDIKRLELQLVPLAEVPQLPEQFDARRVEVQLRLKQSEAEENKATESLKIIEYELSQITVAEALLQRTEDLNVLFAEAGSNRKALNDREQLIRQLDLRERTLSDLKQAQSDQSGIGELKTEALDRSVRTRINQLGSQQAGLAQSLQQARSHRARLDEQITKLRLELVAAPEARSHEDLFDAARDARSEGDLEARLESLRAEVDELDADLKQQLSQLLPWQGTINELKTMSILNAAEIQKWESKFDAHRTEISLLQTRLDELTTDRDRLQFNITELRREFQIPQEADLQTARRRRDDLWSEIQQQISTKTQPASSLLTEFERSIVEADRISDRLRSEADRVAQLADDLEELKSKENRILETGRQIAEVEQVSKNLEHDWYGKWPEFKTTPLHPRQMLAWLAKREIVLQRESHLARRRSEAAALQERIESLTSRLVQCLDEDSHSAKDSLPESSFWPARETAKSSARSEKAASRQQLSLFGGKETETGNSPSELCDGKSHDSLSELLVTAEMRLELFEQQQNSRLQAEESLTRLLADDSVAQDQMSRSQSEFGQWQTAWRDIMQHLNLSPDLSPEVAIASVETLFEAADQRRQADELRKRIHDIEDENNQFIAKVKVICEEIAPDLCDVSAEKAVIELRTRLSNGLRDQTRFNELTTRKKAEEKTIVEVRQSKANSLKSLIELCQLARVDSSTLDRDKPVATNALSGIFESLAQATERSSSRTDCDNRLQKARSQLAELSHPESVETFRDAVDSQTADSLAQRLAELNRQLDQLTTERDRVNQQLGGVTEQLRQMDGSGEAAEAEEKLQLILAQIRSDAENYVRIKLASSVLKSAIERYRDKIRGPVLSVASELFRELTLFSFDGLRVDEDDQSRPILVGLRAGTRDAIPVTGMSEGTCDQLYLALRLASLQLESHPRNRLPFIVDDILIQFDDARAAAALGVLSRFGQQRQVIYFTHHEHLLEIARTELPSACNIHRMDSY